MFYRVRSERSRILHEAWQAGLAKFGLALPWKWEWERRGVEADVAIHYGLWGTLREAAAEYKAAGKRAVFCDLGYWGRLDGGKVAGFHRIAVNAHHAVYLQDIQHPGDRWRYFGITPQPMRGVGCHVLLCGMSAKAAWVYGLGAEEWERQAVEAVRQRTERPIWYRPKPSWKLATPITGTWWKQVPADAPLPLENCWAVVTHHGNTALDALLAGVPAFTAAGIASVLCPPDLAQIERPYYPNSGDVEQLCRDAAYTQYKVDEIAEGKAWRYLLEEGLV